MNTLIWYFADLLEIHLTESQILALYDETWTGLLFAISHIDSQSQSSVAQRTSGHTPPSTQGFQSSWVDSSQLECIYDSCGQSYRLIHVLEKTPIKLEFCMTRIKKCDLSWANWNPCTHPLEISVVRCLASAGCCCTARLPGGPHEGGTRHVEQMTFRIEIQHHRTLRVRSTYSDIRLTYHKAVQNS